MRLNTKQLLDLVVVMLGLALIVWVLDPFGAGSGDGRSGVLGSYRWDWGSLWQFVVRRDADGSLKAGFLLIGLANTLRVSFWAFLLSVALGLILGFSRTLPFLFSRLMAVSIIGLVRNIPPLIVIFIMYFFIVSLFDRYIPWNAIQESIAGSSWLPVLLPTEQLGAFFAAVLALGLYEGAYMAEIVRAGVESVPRSQWEASASLGMGRRVQILYVILPQAFRLMLPPMVNQSVSLVKESSIVSVISVRELTFQGQELTNSTQMVFELWITVTLTYLAICLLISMLGKLLEKRIRWKTV